MGYMLAFARNIPWMDAMIRAGRLDKDTEHVVGRVDSGCGWRWENWQGRHASAQIDFGMRLLGNDIVEVDPVFIREYQVDDAVPLPELLAQADYVSLNCDLNPTSHHLMNDKDPGMMKTMRFSSIRPEDR